MIKRLIFGLCIISLFNSGCWYFQITQDEQQYFKSTTKMERMADVFILELQKCVEVFLEEKPIYIEFHKSINEEFQRYFFSNYSDKYNKFDISDYDIGYQEGRYTPLLKQGNIGIMVVILKFESSKKVLISTQTSTSRITTTRYSEYTYQSNTWERKILAHGNIR